MIEPQFNKNHIINSFNRAAKTYDKAAILQREIAERLLDHLEPMRLQPKVILDLGSAIGYTAKLLKKRYPKATIVSIDIAENMLREAKRKGGWFHKPLCVCGDIERLPFQKSSIDLIFSNLALSWCLDLPSTFQQIRRSLRPDGLFLFSTLGPDTLKELRESWMSVDDNVHTHRFVDMHDIGDALIHAKFLDPVMEMDSLIMEYSDPTILLKDLKNTGSYNISAVRTKGLMGKNHWQKFINAYQKYRQENSSFPATFEIIYGHAWAPKMNVDALAKVDESGEVTISVNHIKRNR